MVINQSGTGKAELFIYDLTGRTMYHYRVNDPVPGIHTVSWDGTNAAGQRLKPGIYECSLITSDGTQSRKILVR